MKKIWFILVWFPCLLLAQDKPQSANDILAAAYQKASKENKNVFVIFHASWCGWCKKMDASMNDSRCKTMFENNYIIVHLTVHENGNQKKEENPGADDVLKKYGAFDTGIPFWLIYNKDGNLLATSFMQSANSKRNNIGCPASEKEVAAFIAILKNTSPLSEAQLAVIAAVFRENDN